MARDPRHDHGFTIPDPLLTKELGIPNACNRCHADKTVDWDAVIADPRFQALHKKKTAFLWGLMAFSVAYYFLLPIGAAFFQDVFKVRVWGPINVGLLFALSEFAVAWAIAFYYSRRANNEFDAMARELITDFEKKGKV